MNKISSKNTFFKNLYYILKKFSKQEALIVVTLLLNSVISFFDPMIQKKIIDDGITRCSWETIISCLAFFIIIWILKNIVDFFQFSISFNMEQNLQFQLLQKGLDRLLKIKKSNYEKNGIYFLTENIKSDIKTISVIVDRNFIICISQIFSVLGCIFGIFYINWQLAIIALSIIPIKVFVVYRFSNIQEKLYKKIMESDERWNEHLGNILQNVVLIKLWNVYSTIRRQTTIKRRDCIKNEFRFESLIKYENISMSFLDMIINIIAYLLGAFIIFSGNLTVGGLISYFSYVSYITNSIGLFSYVKTEFKKIEPSLNRYIKLFEMETDEDTNYENKRSAYVPQAITFDKVSYSYDGKTILNNISFSIKKGEIVALCGENGSGKSTIVNLFLRLISPSSGHIYFDQENINVIDLKSYRELISYVPQTTTFFNASIRDNITMFQKNISVDNVNSIMKKTGLLDFFDKLDFGLETQMNFDGTNFSGGERQKIAILRSLCKKANILILDEPSSSFDQKSVLQMQYLIEKNRDNFDYIFIISHQDEMLHFVDKKIFISNGEINSIYYK